MWKSFCVFFFLQDKISHRTLFIWILCFCNYICIYDSISIFSTMIYIFKNTIYDFPHLWTYFRIKMNECAKNYFLFYPIVAQYEWYKLLFSYKLLLSKRLFFCDYKNVLRHGVKTSNIFHKKYNPLFFFLKIDHWQYQQTYKSF